MLHPATSAIRELILGKAIPAAEIKIEVLFPIQIITLPCREHAVVFSVQLVTNDLVVGAHSSLNSCSHDLLRDPTFKRSQVML